MGQGFSNLTGCTRNTDTPSHERANPLDETHHGNPQRFSDQLKYSDQPGAYNIKPDGTYEKRVKNNKTTHKTRSK